VLYVPYPQYPKWTQQGSLLIRGSLAPGTLARVVGKEIESFGRDYPLSTKTIAQVISQGLVEERVIAMLSGFFAALALLLASVGLYGLMSYSVNRRTREIGIRMALGAQRGTVLGQVLQEAFALGLVGIALGIPCALAANRLIGSMLFGISPDDLPTILAVSVMLLAVTLLAGYMPAQRASRVDPMVALRHE
jgi:ABC-type antimicrobial peptide transport system permease subunit